MHGQQNIKKKEDTVSRFKNVAASRTEKLGLKSAVPRFKYGHLSFKIFHTQKNNNRRIMISEFLELDRLSICPS